jgi:predicted RNase H-like HicB family nuclease
MTHYVAVIESSRNTVGAWFPDVPGCVTAAESEAATIAQAAEALRLWAEDALDCGETLPAPRSLEALKSDPDVMESMSRGAAFVFIPLLVDAGRPARANISLDRNLLDAIDQAAKVRGLTRSAFLASAAREKILSEA